MRRPFSIARFLQRQDKRGARPRRIDRESRTKRIHSSGGGKRDEIGEVPSFSSFASSPAPPFLHSLQHPLTSRPRTTSVSIDQDTSWREQRWGRPGRGRGVAEHTQTRAGEREAREIEVEMLRNRGIGIRGDSPILGKPRVQCRTRIGLFYRAVFFNREPRKPPTFWRIIVSLITCLNSCHFDELLLTMPR